MKTKSHSRSHFAQMYPAHLAAFSTFLIRIRAVVGGDLDMALILTVIGERHFTRRVDESMPTYETMGDTETGPGDSINTLSLAQYTGIPRETARRKVAQLVEVGWVTIDARGNLLATAKAAEDLREGTDAALTFLDHISTAARATSD